MRAGYDYDIETARRDVGPLCQLGQAGMRYQAIRDNELHAIEDRSGAQPVGLTGTQDIAKQLQRPNEFSDASIP